MSIVGSLAAKSLRFATQMAQAHSVGSMNSLIVITRTGSYDNVLREYDSSASQTIYDNLQSAGAGAKAGISNTQGPTSLSLGDETQYYSSITVYIPQDGPSTNVRIGDTVRVVSCPDNDIDGRIFRVTNLDVGGRIHSSISMQATGIAPSKEWV